MFTEPLTPTTSAVSLPVSLPLRLSVSPFVCLRAGIVAAERHRHRHNRPGVDDCKIGDGNALPHRVPSEKRSISVTCAKFSDEFFATPRTDSSVCQSLLLVKTPCFRSYFTAFVRSFVLFLLSAKESLLLFECCDLELLFVCALRENCSSILVCGRHRAGVAFPFARSESNGSSREHVSVFLSRRPLSYRRI